MLQAAAEVVASKALLGGRLVLFSKTPAGQSAGGNIISGETKLGELPSAPSSPKFSAVELDPMGTDPEARRP